MIARKQTLIGKVLNIAVPTAILFYGCAKPKNDFDINTSMTSQSELNRIFVLGNKLPRNIFSYDHDNDGNVDEILEASSPYIFNGLSDVDAYIPFSEDNEWNHFVAEGYIGKTVFSTRKTKKMPDTIRYLANNSIGFHGDDSYPGNPLIYNEKNGFFEVDSH